MVWSSRLKERLEHCCNILLPCENKCPLEYFECIVLDPSFISFALFELNLDRVVANYEACRLLLCAASLAIFEYHSSRRFVVT